MPAPFSIFFNATAIALRRLRQPTKVLLDTIEIECTLNELHSYDSVITEFEVEQGFNVTDHRMTRPIEFSMTGIISDTPSDLDAIREAAEVGAGLLGNVASIATQTAFQAVRFSGNLISGNAVITQQAFKKLLKLYTDGGVTAPKDNVTPPGVFTIVTKYRTYSNMVVRSISFPRDRRTGDALQFSASFREIRIVETMNAVFTTPAAQTTNPLGQMGGEKAPDNLVNEKSLLWQGSEKLSPTLGGKLSNWRDSLEKSLGITTQSVSPEDIPNLGVYPMPPPPPSIKYFLPGGRPF